MVPAAKGGGGWGGDTGNKYREYVAMMAGRQQAARGVVVEDWTLYRPGNRATPLENLGVENFRVEKGRNLRT